MAQRELSDWLSSYIEYTKDTEPPLSYHTWIACSAIAGAMQRKCFLRWGHTVLYPNLYIILVGKSGGTRKGTAMSIAVDILKDAQGIDLVADAITSERLIQKMEEINSTFMDSAGVIKPQSAMTCFSEELSVFLGQRDIKFLANLTAFYDSRDDWSYETKTKGEQHIHGVCFNFLGATAPDWMQSMFPQEAIGGGFTSRVIFIYEERKRESVPDEPYDDGHRKLRKQLVHDLNIISNLVLEYEFSPAARKLYIDWYKQADEDNLRGNLAVPDPRFSGYCDRRANHIRKLCMVLTASRSNSGIIEVTDFDRALALLKSAEMKMAKTFSGMGRSAYSETVEMVLDYLIIRKTCTRSELLKRFYMDIDPPTLKVVEEVLTHMKVIKISIDSTKNDYVYRLVE